MGSHVALSSARAAVPNLKLTAVLTMQHYILYANAKPAVEAGASLEAEPLLQAVSEDAKSCF